MAEDLISRDARHVWHPYTQAATEPAPIAVRSASGARLVLDDEPKIAEDMGQHGPAHEDSEVAACGTGDYKLVKLVAVGK